MLAAHSWAALANAPVGIVASIEAAKAHFASRRHNFSAQTLLAPVRYPPRRRLIPTPQGSRSSIVSIDLRAPKGGGEPMSALGQKRTNGDVGLMSVMLPGADIHRQPTDVRYVP